MRNNYYTICPSTPVLAAESGGFGRCVFYAATICKNTCVVSYAFRLTPSRIAAAAATHRTPATTHCKLIAKAVALPHALAQSLAAIAAHLDTAW
jgi:hypothetical protein